MPTAIVTEWVDATANSATVAATLENLSYTSNTSLLIQHRGEKIRFIRVKI